MLTFSPLLHFGLSCAQFPDVWQVVFSRPSLEYPLLQVKVASVSTGYLPLNFLSGEYVTEPHGRVKGSQSTTI